MDNDHLEGIGHQVKGAIIRALGSMIGDAKLTAEGTAEMASGDAQVAAAPSNGHLMGIDADRIKGVAHQLEGALRQSIGKAIADPAMQQAGSAEREAGKLRNAAGSARDTLRDAARDPANDTVENGQ